MTVALGVIGFGIMGERLLRAALAHDSSVIRVAGIWDPAPEAADRLAAVVPELKMMSSPDDVISGCDALYVATPPASHLLYARAGFAANRAVLLEKPLAENLAAARAFVTAAEAHGERAAVNFPMASSPAVAQLAAWREALGTPRALTIDARFAAWPRGWQSAAAGWLGQRAEGGFTREVLSHFLFLARRQLGPLVLLEGHATYPTGAGAETAINASLTAGDVPVSITGSVGTTDRDELNEWRLEAEGGAIRLRDWSIAERQAPDGSWHTAPDALPNAEMRPMVLRGQLDKLAALTRGERVDLATLREALEVQEIVEAILAGAQTS